MKITSAEMPFTSSRKKSKDNDKIRMKKPNVIYALLFGLLMVFLFSFMVQEHFHPFKTKALKGNFGKVEMPPLTVEFYKNGYFQKASEKYVSAHFGFREPIIRLYNQYCWDFFRKEYVSFTYVGKENWLFYGHNVNDYYGTEMYEWFANKEEARNAYDKEVRLLNKVRSILEQYDVTLLTMVAPSKSSIYPEYLPRRDFDTTSLNARKYYLDHFAETGMPCLDMTEYFLKLKDTCSFYLFPPTGDHWNFSTVYATDTLMRFMEQLRGIHMPRIEYGNEWRNTCCTGDDKNVDMEPDLNLMRPIRYNPKFNYKERDYEVVCDTACIKPIVLAIGNSFFFRIKNYIPPRQACSHFDFWYYNRVAYQGVEELIDTVALIDRLGVLLDAEYVVWSSSASQMYRATESFAEDAIIQLCIGEQRFEERLNELNDSLYEGKGDLAKLDAMMRKDPEAYFPEIRGDSIPKTRNPRLLEEDFWAQRDIRRQIKHDPQWMAAITTKMPILELKLQDAVDLEATNVMEGRQLMRDTKTSCKEYKEMMIMKTIQQIKNNPTWYQTVVKDAEKKDVSIEQNLHDHAEYTVNTLIGEGTITLPED